MRHLGRQRDVEARPLLPWRDRRVLIDELLCDHQSRRRTVERIWRATIEHELDDDPLAARAAASIQLEQRISN